MVNESLREIIFDRSPFALLYSEPSFDNSIIGVDNKGRVVYEYDKMVKELTEDSEMNLEEAAEFIDFNTIGAYMGEYTPIVIYPVDN